MTKICKMNPKVKHKWLTALRSGKYEQGVGALRDVAYGGSTPLFCCLGVLCKVADIRPHRWNQGGLGKKSLDLVGFDKTVQDKLINFNDEAGWSFNTIAKWVQKHL